MTNAFLSRRLGGVIEDSQSQAYTSSNATLAPAQTLVATIGSSTDECYDMLRSSQLSDRQISSQAPSSPSPALAKRKQYSNMLVAGKKKLSPLSDGNDDLFAEARISETQAHGYHFDASSSPPQVMHQALASPAQRLANATPLPRRSSSNDDSSISTPQAIKMMMQGEAATPASQQQVLGDLFSPGTPFYSGGMVDWHDSQSHEAAPSSASRGHASGPLPSSGSRSSKRTHQRNLFASPPSTQPFVSSQGSHMLQGMSTYGAGHVVDSSDALQALQQSPGTSNTMQTRKKDFTFIPSSISRPSRGSSHTPHSFKSINSIRDTSRIRDAHAAAKLSDILTSSLDDDYSAPPSPTLRAAAALPSMASKMHSTSAFGTIPPQKKYFKGHAHVNYYGRAPAPVNLKRKLPLQVKTNNNIVGRRVAFEDSKAAVKENATPLADDASPPLQKKRKIIPRLAAQPSQVTTRRSAAKTTVQDTKKADKDAEEKDAACILLSLGRSCTGSKQYEEVPAARATERTLRAVRRMALPPTKPKISNASGSASKATLVKKRREAFVASVPQRPSLSAPAEAALFRDLPAEDTARMRVFAPDLPVMATKFSQWYRRFPISSVLSPELHDKVFNDPSLTHASRSDEQEWTKQAAKGARKMGVWKEPESPLDLYSARWMRGSGRDKEGLCPICYEEGRNLFLKSKTSQFNYHLINQHGISPHTKKPIHPPVQFRTIPMTKAGIHERKEMLQGKCHACKSWIHLESVKEGDVKVPEIYWWKHASQCHKKVDNDDEAKDIFIEDKLFEQIQKVLEEA